MRLDLIDDSEFKPSEKFSIQIKNHKCYFTLEGKKYVFGSKLYPIGKRAGIFSPWNTENGDYEEVARAIEDSNWKPRNGYCYTNAEILWKTFKHFGVDAKYYAGWAFPSSGYPIHHAWVVVGDDVYDLGVNITSQKVFQKQIMGGKDQYSKECIREIKEIERNWKPVRENFTWGNAFMFYVGSEITPHEARVQYNKAVEDVSTHPSYASMGKTGKHIRSKYQQLLEDAD